MADRYDPKLSVRPLGDRKVGDARPQSAGADDPLFELARIVSGRAGAPASGPSRSRTVLVAAEPALPSAAEQADALGALEAELLSDLQASFAAVKEAVAAPPLAPAAPPPQQAASTSPTPAPAKPAEAVMRAPAATPPAPPPSQQQPQPSRFAAARPPLQAVPPPQPASAPAAQPPARPAAQRPAAPAAENRVDIANLQLRPTVALAVKAPSPPAAEATAQPSRERPSRWEKPPEPAKPQQSAASRFAPPRAVAAAQPAQPAPPPPAADTGDELPFGEAPPFAMQQPEGQEEEFSLEGFDLASGLADEDQIPPYPEEELESLGRRRFPRGVAILAGVVVVAVVGGAAAMFLRPGTSGTTKPPIISADATPTKVAPPESPAPAADADRQNKLIYDRVDAKSAGAPAETRLVTPGSEPIASVPAPASDSAISRVILPGGPGVDSKAGSAAAQLPTVDFADSADDSKQIGPRKVRTVVVKPDGTIVSSEAAPAGDAAAVAKGAQGAAPATATANPPVLPPAQNDDTAAIAGHPGGQELAITPAAGAATAPQPPPAKAQPATPVVRNDAPAAKPVQPQPQPQQKVVDGAAPIDLTPARPANRPPAQQQASLAPAQAQAQPPAVAAGGMLVQVSSQRSEDAARATFRDLQARYPMLAGYQPNIQKADLGDRGTYYRVRVGPLAGNDAQRLCDALKNAGGDCVLAAR